MWIQSPAGQYIEGEWRQIWFLQHSGRRRGQAGTEGVCRLANVPTVMDRWGFSWWFGYCKSRTLVTVNQGKILADNVDKMQVKEELESDPEFLKAYSVNKSGGPAAPDQQSRAAVAPV